MNNKKMTIFILIMLLIYINVCVLLFYNYKSNDFKKNSFIITTSLQDSFTIYKKIRPFRIPDISFDYKIYQNVGNQKKLIIEYVEEAEDYFTLFYEDNNIKVYKYIPYIIYRYSNEKYFNALNIYSCEELEVNDRNSLLIPVARKLIFIDYSIELAEFLIKSKDSETLNFIKQFINNELDPNFQWYADEDMKAYINEILSKYNINLL